MIRGVLPRSRMLGFCVPKRGFSSFSGLCNKAAESAKKFDSPQEHIAKKQLEQIEEQAYQESLLNDEFEYAPKYLSSENIDPLSGRPMPINVELLKYKPITLPQTHGHQAAQIKFKSFDQESLTRASEFAGRAAFYLGIPCKNVQPLKTERRLYTVIRSPFAQAKSKENFHRVTYQCKLTAFDANPEVIELWLSFINKYAIEGVEYKASIHTREGLDFVDKLDKLTSEDFKLPEAYADLDDPISAKVQQILKSEDFKKFFDQDAKK